MEEMLAMLVKGQENQEVFLKEIKADIVRFTQKVDLYAIPIKQFEHWFRQILTTLNQGYPGTILRNTVQNLKNNGNVLNVTMRNGITTTDPSLPAIIVIDIDTPTIKYQNITGA